MVIPGFAGALGALRRRRVSQMKIAGRCWSDPAPVIRSPDSDCGARDRLARIRPFHCSTIPLHTECNQAIATAVYQPLRTDMIACRRAPRLRRRFSILVVAAPPFVRRSLRPTGRRVLPFLLPPERGEIEECEGADYGLDPASIGEVGVKNVPFFAKENAEAEILSLRGRSYKVLVETRALGRDPGSVQPMRRL
jgi:hypothetical protein